MITMFEKGDWVEQCLMVLSEDGKEATTLGYFCGIVDDGQPSEKPRMLRHLVWIDRFDKADYKGELVDMDADWVAQFNENGKPMQLCDPMPLHSDRIVAYNDCLADKGIDLLTAQEKLDDEHK